MLDRPWLVSDPLGSMAALHSQPPLRNLLLSVIGLAAPGNEVAVLRVLHLMLGIAAMAAMLDLLRRLRVRAPVAVGATLLWSVSPAALLWEQDPSYNYPLTAVLVLMAWCFCVAAQRRSTRWLWIAAGVAAVPDLTWSMFHLLWLVAIFAAVALTCRLHAASRHGDRSGASRAGDGLVHEEPSSCSTRSPPAHGRV